MSILASFDITATNGSKSAQITGDIAFLGFRRNDQSVTNTYAHVGVVNARATKISDENFEVTYQIYGDAAFSYSTGTKSYSTSSTKQTNGADSISWIYERSPYIYYDGQSYDHTGNVGILVTIKWTGDSSYTYARWVQSLTVPNKTKSSSQSISFNAPNSSDAPWSIWNRSANATSITMDSLAPTTSSSSGYQFRKWELNGTYINQCGELYVSSLSSLGNSVSVNAVYDYKITYTGGTGVTNLPVYDWKRHNENYTISSKIPKLSGKTFLNWLQTTGDSSSGYGDTYNSGSTYSRNNPAGLHAQFRNPTASPSIGWVKPYRCNSSGTYDYDGSYVKVEVDWEVDRNYIQSNTGTVTGRYKVYGTSTYTALTFSSGASGAGGTAIATFSADTTKAYVFEITVEDSVREDNHGYTITVTTTLGYMLPHSYAYTLNNSTNFVQVNGTLKYMGYYKVQSGVSEYNTSYNGHRIGVYGATAQKSGGVDCLLSCGGKGSYDPTTFTELAPVPDKDGLEQKSVSSSAVSWDDTHLIFQSYNTDSITSLYDHYKIVVLKFAVTWSGTTYTFEKEIPVSVPLYESTNEHTVEYVRTSIIGNGVIPAKMICPRKSPNIAITGLKADAVGYTFNRWSTAEDGSGTTWNPSAVKTYSNIGTPTRLYPIMNPYIYFQGRDVYGNVPSDRVKTFGVAYTLPSSIPTLLGYVFTGYNTNSDGSGTTYQPNGTVPASQNTYIMLYPQWRLKTPAPTITSIIAYRCDSSGNRDDAGTYCKVTAVWSVDRTYDSNNTGTVTGKKYVYGSSTGTSFSFSSGASGASGTATAIVSGISTDSQYTIEITVTDSNTDTGHTSSVSSSVILTRARFVLDLYHGGTGMGIGSAAPQSGLEIGWSTQIDGNLTVLGNVTANNLDSISTVSGDSVATPNSGYTLRSAYVVKYGPIIMIVMKIRPTSSLSASTSYTLGTIASTYRPSYDMGYANQLGSGYIATNGTVYFVPRSSVGTSSDIIVSLVHIKS